MEQSKLKLEDYCLTVEQAKELKELGIDMDNPLFEYIQLVNDKQYIEPIEKRVLGKPFLYNNTLSTLVVGGNKMYELVTPTLTNTEMLEMLPKEIDGYKLNFNIGYFRNGDDKYYIGYLKTYSAPLKELESTLLRNSLFGMIKWLKTNKLM